MRRVALLAVAVLLLTAAAHRRAVAPPSAPDVVILIPRSLVITDPDVIGGFTFQRVLQALITRAGVQQTPLQLYQQWFDTQNPKPGMVVADAPHCDDFITDGKPSFNGFVRRCPTPEGVLATSDPFTANDYHVLGITNRFDQTPSDGSNCGQYRIIFSRAAGGPPNHIDIIFEGVLPNPNPSAGIAACKPVAQFWADLSNVDAASDRRARIEQFFFDGIPGFSPLLTPENFNNGGRIRNKHVTAAHAAIPRFYQFVVEKRCANGSNCRLVMQPDVLENLPFGPLYDASVDSSRGAALREELIKNIPTLALRDVNYYVNFSKDNLIAESDPADDFLAFSSGPPYNKGVQTSQAGKDFDARVRAELKRIGSTLTPQDLTTRLDLQNCEGCHLGGANLGEGVLFPRALGDSHITPNGISPALHDVFAPNRAKVLHDFLVFGTPPPVHVN